MPKPSEEFGRTERAVDFVTDHVAVTSITWPNPIGVAMDARPLGNDRPADILISHVLAAVRVSGEVKLCG